MQNLSYEYDKFGNLASRKDNLRNLEETFHYDKMNRLTDIYLGTTHSQIVYDPLGRMTTKQADGETVFANAAFAAAQGQPARPHAMKSAETAEGVFPSATQEITYTGFDKVKTIAEGGNTLAYTYGHDQQRIRMVENVGDITRTKDYVGFCEFITEDDGENTTEKTLTYLVGPYGVFAVVEQQDNEEAIHYILKDHLGSWTTITDNEGNVVQELSFDAWGNLRDPETWSGSYSGTPMFDRGFTGHEHMTAFGLINMNGRCYDPLTSSFLSVDAYVQDPTSAQAFNRYAYCGYNPLRYTDPTGWSPDGYGRQPQQQCYDPTARYHSDDPNDVLWGRSVHPCANSSSGYVNGTAVTSTGYTQGNVPNYEYNGMSGEPIIDLSELSESQQEVFNSSMEFASANSALFKKLYEILVNSPVIYKILLGETDSNVPGQFNPEDNTITFRDESELTQYFSYGEELFHAFQLSENKSLYDASEFNYEYEAKVFNFFVYAQFFYRPFNVTQNDSFIYTINFFSNGFDVIFPTAQTITGNVFLNGYYEGARRYAEWNILNNYGNSNYKKSTFQPPVSLIRLFQ